MVLVKRKLAKVNEDNSSQNIVISDANLVQLYAQAQQKKANAKKTWDNACQEYENTVAQLLAKQADLNKQNASNNTNTQNTNQDVNEGINTKHIVIGEIIGKVLKNIEVSYILSDKDIQRLARKINDYFNSHKDDFDISAFRLIIKNYFLGHSSISLSQREINDFLDEFIKEISKSKYSQFSKFFAKEKDYEVDLTDIENVDEFEAELSDSNFEFDEDLENDILVVTNLNSLNKDLLQKIISRHSF